MRKRTEEQTTRGLRDERKETARDSLSSRVLLTGHGPSLIPLVPRSSHSSSSVTYVPYEPSEEPNEVRKERKGNGRDKTSETRNETGDEGDPDVVTFLVFHSPFVSLATHVPRLASVTHFSFPSLGRVTRVARATTRR